MLSDFGAAVPDADVAGVAATLEVTGVAVTPDAAELAADSAGDRVQPAVPTTTSMTKPVSSLRTAHPHAPPTMPTVQSVLPKPAPLPRTPVRRAAPTGSVPAAILAQLH
ncbi:hypothetical protein GCM10010168_79440 [Actinoplanes ianthinogenes]|uniref:Uncharacterized protein n=1 Tax=Actinoplanes ianthinogenes TaxID=122358 RepID=A0ABM7LK00_9ACTN|nr:hypothetical protein Aiant_02580 [Actinoplanes ianthinogenes]GGR48618.1 hypothetical protein GCM10010168_79440 [Actinoplanes ianthinogenes]